MVADLVDALVARECPHKATVLHLFSGPYVTCGTRRLEVPEGSKRLVAFVALHLGRVDRRRTAGILWASAGDERAAGNLRSALWRLNRAGLDLLRADKSSLVLRDGVLTDSDVVGRWASRLVNGCPAVEDLDVVPAGADSVELLAGWYDDWALLERERLRQRILHALEAMSRLLVTRRRCAQAIETAMVAVAVEPLRESAQRVLLEAHLAEGNWVEGRRALDSYRRLLRSELDIEPDVTLEELLRARPAGGLPAARRAGVSPSATCVARFPAVAGGSAADGGRAPGRSVPATVARSG